VRIHTATEAPTVGGLRGLAAVGGEGTPTRVPVSRYIDPEFAALEQAALWPRVWHLACSVDHVAGPGDVFEHRLGPLSVLVVRGEDGELRAFQNVCLHRGNAICNGSASGLTELRCPYHRWAWDLAGNLREVPSRRGFGAIHNDDYPLPRVQVGTWGPMVFVNLDLTAPPLDDWLEGLPADAAALDLDSFACIRSITTPVAANWKTVSDGFSETYHIQGIHRDLLGCIDDIHAPQRLWEWHGLSVQTYGVPSPRLGREVEAQAVWDSFVVTQGARMGLGKEPTPVPEVPEGSSLQAVIAERIREFNRSRGIDLSRFDDGQILDLRQYNLFPNATVLAEADLLTVMFTKPGPTPDEAELVFLQFDRVPTSGVRPRPLDLRLQPDQVDFGTVLNADFGILRTAQRGMHQPGFTHLSLSTEECRIIHLHRNLERFLGISPSEIEGGPVSGRLAEYHG
jgi:nitrite reductase/ring-hydroxylating ferredoxin subunit